MITLALAGDVMLGRGVEARLRGGLPPDAPWGDTLSLLHEADLRIVNLECALTAQRTAWRRTFKVFHFGADPALAIPVLTAARIDAVTLANNHTLDFEVEGLRDTLAALDEAGIAWAGAGEDAREAARAAVLPVAAHGHRVALLAYTDNEPAFAAAADQPGTNYLPVSADAQVMARVAADIAGARALGADVVIVSYHWGPNMVQRPPASHRRFARAAIDFGADVVHGHSAHLAQGLELYRGRPILYDTGDFLDDYAVDPELRNDWSFLFRLCLEPGTLVHLELWPVQLTVARVARAVGAERMAIMARMRGLCAELGTELVEHRGALVLPGRPPAHLTAR